MREIVTMLTEVAKRPSVSMTFIALFLVYWITTTVQMTQAATNDRMEDLMGQMIHLTAATAAHNDEAKSQTRVLRAMCINWAPTPEAQNRCLLD